MIPLGVSRVVEPPSRSGRGDCGGAADGIPIGVSRLREPLGCGGGHTAGSAADQIPSGVASLSEPHLHSNVRRNDRTFFEIHFGASRSAELVAQHRARAEAFFPQGLCVTEKVG